MSTMRRVRRRTGAPPPTCRIVAALTTATALGVLAPSTRIAATTPDQAGTGSPDTTSATPPTTGGGGGGGGAADGDLTWLWILLITVGVVVLAVGVIAILRRPGPARSDGAADLRREQAGVLATAQWFRDHLSIELLTTPLDQAAPRWALERRRIDDLVHAAIGQSRARDDLWQQLGAATATLARAIDVSLERRAQQPLNSAMIADAGALSARRRDELGAVLDALWPLVRSR